MIFALANKFLSIQPRYVPGFVYGWLSLVSHRVFMSDMLNMPERAGWAPYCAIMQALLSYIGEQLKAANITYVAKDLYKGVLRILLILHHDFPEFVAENHFEFCNVIPAHCAQLRNLVLSAYPLPSRSCLILSGRASRLSASKKCVRSPRLLAILLRPCSRPISRPSLMPLSRMRVSPRLRSSRSARLF
jgi:Cell division control protein, negative regulator of transcription